MRVLSRASSDEKCLVELFESDGLRFGEDPCKPTCLALELAMTFLSHDHCTVVGCRYCHMPSLAPRVGKARDFCSESCKKIWHQARRRSGGKR